MAKVRVPKSVLLDGAQMSSAAFIAGTMGFLKKRKIPIQDWVSYIGKHFEDAWTGLEDNSAAGALQHLIVLEAMPLGAEVRSTELTKTGAEATLTPLPSRAVLGKFGTTPTELLRSFGVTQKDVASLYAMFEPAAKAVGLRYTHELQGRKQVLRLESAGGRQTASKGGAGRRGGKRAR